MERLTNKDISFEPMQELHDKLPTWMHKNEISITLKDLKRYRVQQRPLCEFKERGYSYSNHADREFTVSLQPAVQHHSPGKTFRLVRTLVGGAVLPVEGIG